MAKSQKLEAAIAQIKSLQSLEQLSEGDISSLQKIVQGKQPIAIALATKLIISHHLTQLIPDLIATFHKLLQNGAKTDPGCKAKWAIANTLYQLERPDADLFLAGVRHIQQESVWGGNQDTAPALRSLCALGLVQANYTGVLHELADLLADAEHDARAGAARAVGYSQNPAGIPLLRLKLHIGDAEPVVLSECFVALLQLSAEQAPMVVQFLDSKNEVVQELAAIALAEARVPDALPAIKQQWKQTRERALRQSFLLAIATLRTDDAINFLTDLLDRGSAQDAKDAVIALDIYRDTTEVWQRVMKTAELRADAEILSMM